jgi:hypothetical protein
MPRTQVPSQPTGVHWGEYDSVATLPGTPLGVVVEPNLNRGDLAVVGSQLYTCSSPAPGAAVWVPVVTAAGAVTAPIHIDAQGPVRLPNIPVGAVAYGSLGTSAVHVAGSLYVAETFVPTTRVVTGISILNGATASTDNVIAALYSAAGARLAHSALAGVLATGTNAFQDFALTAPYTAVGPARYFVVIQVNGTTTTTRRIAASTYLNRASIIAGTFGTLPATITPPTGVEANAGPIAVLY